MIVTFNTESTDIVAIAYSEYDSGLNRPAAQIRKIGNGDYVAEGYTTGYQVHRGNAASCVEALREYGKGLSYGDPDTDWRLLAL